mgnify:CR=1 FL=1
MKRSLGIILCAVLLVGLLCGCQAEKPGCTKYTLVQMGLEGMLQSAATVRQVTGIRDLYLKLYEDGTAQMRVSQEIIELAYEDGKIWRVDDPSVVCQLVLQGSTAKVIDNFYVYEFKK